MDRLQIGPYLVARNLGRGGMGEVYLATDTRLDRQVAIKALPAHFAQDSDRLTRFQREAKILASLNHSGIGAIYGLEEADGRQYLILEYVDGETLAERLARGPIPVEETLTLARQIAESVEVAHDKGIIHRDLKPGNVMVTHHGRVKVLDFGLARSADERGSLKDGGRPADRDLLAPTVTSPAFTDSPTIPGAILGTAGYMSPEQARGKPVDKRSDIFSFGCVLYEMLTGAMPFRGETVADSIGATLHKEMDFALLPPATPPTIRFLLAQCLAKDKANRLRDMGDARLALGQAISDPRGAALGFNSAAEPPRRRGLQPVLAGALAVAALIAGMAAGAAWSASSASLSEPARIVRKLELLSIGPDEDFDASSPVISPDGMKIAFIHDDAVKVRDLSTFDVVTIVEDKNAQQLTWSPDGRSLVYGTGSELFRVLTTGGASAVRIGKRKSAFPFAWTTDDRLIFADGGDPDGIFEMPARGGTPRLLLEAREDEVVDFHAVAAIPGTNVLLIVRHRTDQRIPVEAWDGSRSVIISEFEDQYLSAPVWSPSGHVLFARGFGKLDLWAVPFSPERMEVTGDPFLVQTDATAPSVSAAGTLSFVRGSANLSGELVWVLPDGSTELIGDGGKVVNSAIVSPDGSRIAFAGGSNPMDQDIWVRDLERGINTRVSSLEGFVVPIAWSPDGREIAAINFNPAARKNDQTTRFLAADGSGESREPYVGILPAFNADWTRAVVVSDPRRGSTTASVFDLEQMAKMGDLTAEISMGGVAISPDGELMLYESRESGESQIYCTRFPSGEGRWQISGDGGSSPAWSPDGSWAYYQNTENELIRVSVTREPSIRFGTPEKVFAIMPKLAEFGRVTPAPDGKRFISVRGRDDEAAKAGYKLMLIENWFEEFRSR